MKNFLNNRGSILIIFYITLVALISFGAILLALSTTDSRSAERQRRTLLALYTAEAGIERAIYDLREDYVASKNFADGNINGLSVGPSTGSFVPINYSGTTLNGGSYAVSLRNVTGLNSHVWIRSTGTVGDISQTIQIYAQGVNVSVWNNAIFAGAGASGAMINGNVDIRGSVHILGNGLNPTDLAVDLGGTAELIGNNYKNLSATLLNKVPALPTTVVNGKSVTTLSAILRVKKGVVGLSGSATAGEVNDDSNTYKEQIDASYVTNGFGGNQGINNVHSDNGYTNPYDLGDIVRFPSLSDPCQATDPCAGYANYQDYLYNNALVISNAADLAKFAAITPTSSFSYSSPKGSISFDGSGNMTISGIVYINGGGINMDKAGSDVTINYTGQGSLFATGNININANLYTSGNNSFPTNIVGIMTPGSITFNESNIDAMGLFYAETQINALKQTDIVGTIVSNFFNMGINVPSIFQVPDTINHIPPGMIAGSGGYTIKVVSWQKI